MRSMDEILKGYTFDDTQEKRSIEIKQNPDIYRMDYKEFQMLIYNQLEDIKSSLNSVIEVLRKG